MGEGFPWIYALKLICSRKGGFLPFSPLANNNKKKMLSAELQVCWALSKISCWRVQPFRPAVPPNKDRNARFANCTGSLRNDDFLRFFPSEVTCTIPRKQRPNSKIEA